MTYFYLFIFLNVEQELTSHLNAPVVYAHNDLLSGNLMLNEEEGNYALSLPL